MANRFLSNIRINDAYILPASDGTSGQVISTDGAGNLSFIDAGSSGVPIIYKDDFSGDGSTVIFQLANAVDNIGQTQVYIDGVYQEKETYSVSSTTLTFSTAPPSGTSIEVISFNGVNFEGNFIVDTLKFTGGIGNQGLLSWNTEDETLDLIVSPNVTYQIGQELGHTVRNLSGTTLNNGAVVRVTGASGNKITVDLADNTAELGSSETFAVVTESISNNSTGKVTTEGLVRGLNTSAFAEGVAIWLGTNGAFTDTKPLTPNHLVHIGWVVRSHATEGAILVKVSNGWEIEELHDVLITTATDKDMLVWNNTQGYWENSKTLGDITTGNITTDGTVDGVDISLFKSDYDTHTHTESEITDFGNYLTNVTHDTVNTKLVVTKRDGTTTDLNLAQYIDDTNLARLTSGSLDAATGIATFTRDDATTFTVDFSALFDDTDTDTNDFLTGASFDTTDGVLTLNVSNQTDVTVDLDGRYLESFTETDTLATVTSRGSSTTAGITVNGTISLPQNPVGTTYGNGVSTVPSYMIQQAAGDNDGIRLYAEAGVTNDVRFIFEVVDDLETGDTWVFRNKKTYTDYLANEVVKISGAGDITASGTLSASGYNNSNWDTAYGWGDHSNAGYLTSFDITTQTDPKYLRSDTSDTMNGDLSVHGNILLTGDATTTNQGRLIDFTGFDKEGTTDFTDRAYIRHTVNTGGHSGSVLEISSQNDSSDGIAFTTHSSSTLKHNGNDIITSATIGSQSVNNADTVDGYHASGLLRLGEPTFGNGTGDDTTGPIEFIRDSGTSWDDYIIKHGSTKGMFGKKGVGWHAHTDSSFHVMSSGWVSNFGVNSDGTTVSRTSSRAPIFYDSNDTAWYTDPASRSILNTLQLGGSSSDTTNLKLDVQGNMAIRGNSGLYYGVTTDNYNSWTTRMYASSSTQYFNAQNFIFDNQGYGSTTFATINNNGVYANVYWDSSNTNYYVDAAATSKLAEIVDSRGSRYIANYHSGSDFADGTLVATDIPATDTNGASFVIEVTGKSYTTNVPPFSFMAQGYLYNNTIIATSGVNNGDLRLTYIKVMELNGYLHFWWPRISYWNSFEARVRDAGGSPINRVTGISNSSDPSGATKKVQINLAMSTLYGYNTNASTLYATNYYDSDNTGYYVDPNGTSNLLGPLNIYDGDAAANPRISLGRSASQRLYVSVDDRAAVIGHQQDETSGEHSLEFYINSPTASNNKVFYWKTNDGTLAYLDSAGFKSNVYYDRDNTNYYVDPNGTSVLGGTRFYPTLATGRGSYSEANANIILEATSATPSGYANIEFLSNYNYPSDGASITYYTGIDGGEASQLRIRLNNDYNDGIALWGGYIDFNCKTIDGASQGRRDPIFRWLDYDTQIMYLNNSGNLWVSGDVIAFSDERVKKNISKIHNACDLVKKINGVYYERTDRDTEKRKIGFVAQNILEYLPELVSENQEGMYSVAYGNMTAVLVEAIKELSNKVEELENKLNGTN